jgi:hypothetical protein
MRIPEASLFASGNLGTARSNRVLRSGLTKERSRSNRSRGQARHRAPSMDEQRFAQLIRGNISRVDAFLDSVTAGLGETRSKMTCASSRASMFEWCSCPRRCSSAV